MLKGLIVCISLVAASAASAQYNRGGNSYGSGGYNYGTGSNPNGHYVQPYTRSDGGYVDGYYRSNPNGTTSDNYGARGNVNPYTGRTGTRYGY